MLPKIEKLLHTFLHCSTSVIVIDFIRGNRFCVSTRACIDWVEYIGNFRRYWGRIKMAKLVSCPTEWSEHKEKGNWTTRKMINIKTPWVSSRVFTNLYLFENNNVKGYKMNTNLDDQKISTVFVSPGKKKVKIKSFNFQKYYTPDQTLKYHF